MPTANEQYQDAIVSHEIGLRRLGNSTLRRVISVIERTRPDLRALIMDRLARIEERGIDIGPVTTARLQRLEEDLQGLLRTAYAEIDAIMGGDMEAAAAYEVAWNQRTAGQLLPVALSAAAVPSTDQLRAIVYSQPFQGRVLRDWVSQLEAGDRRRTMDAIRIGMMEGETPTQITRRVIGTRPLNYRDGVRQVTRRGAQMMVNTAMSHVSNRARQAWAQSSGLVEQEVYTATLDSKTTFVCASLDGQRFDVGKGPTPPLHPNCRSVRNPVFDDGLVGQRPANAVTERELEGLSPTERRARIRELVGPVPAETTFNDWLKRRPKSFVDDYLGETRSRLFREGKLSMKDLVDRNGQPWTLAELAQREGVNIDA